MAFFMDSFLFHQHTIPKQERFANSPLVSIFIIDKGAIIDSGTYQELLKKNEQFKKM